MTNEIKPKMVNGEPVCEFARNKWSRDDNGKPYLDRVVPCGNPLADGEDRCLEHLVPYPEKLLQHAKTFRRQRDEAIAERDALISGLESIREYWSTWDIPRRDELDGMFETLIKRGK